MIINQIYVVNNPINSQKRHNNLFIVFELEKLANLNDTIMPKMDKWSKMTFATLRTHKPTFPCRYDTSLSQSRCSKISSHPQRSTLVVEAVYGVQSSTIQKSLDIPVTNLKLKNKLEKNYKE